MGRMRRKTGRPRNGRERHQVDAGYLLTQALLPQDLRDPVCEVVRGLGREVLALLDEVVGVLVDVGVGVTVAW